MSEQLPPLVVEENLRGYLERELGTGSDLEVERHQAGHSNETFFLRYDGKNYVLRRPPRGAFLPSAHDVGREYRVLTALRDTNVRVPKTVLLCSDEEVIGAPFYVMERVDGVVIRDDLPAFLTEEHRQRIGEELVDTLVELHSVDVDGLDLENFGRTSGYLERQLRRWTGQLELTLPFTRPLPELERLSEWLRDNLPDSPPTTLVHGDYKLDNVMYAPQTPARLAAILDWEMSTFGDPLADLGWMSVFWLDPTDEAEGVFARTTMVTTMPGFQRRNDLVERYAQVTGRDVSALGWYQVLAIWKLAILLEGSYARHLAGMTDDPFFAELEHGVPGLARKALEFTQA